MNMKVYKKLLINTGNFLHEEGFLLAQFSQITVDSYLNVWNFHQRKIARSTSQGILNLAFIFGTDVNFMKLIQKISIRNFVFSQFGAKWLNRRVKCSRKKRNLWYGNSCHCHSLTPSSDHSEVSQSLHREQSAFQYGFDLQQ